MEAAENVQQHLHDTFIDTTWPACPSHPNHPLWLGEDHGRIWCCPVMVEKKLPSVP